MHEGVPLVLPLGHRFCPVHGLLENRFANIRTLALLAPQPLGCTYPGAMTLSGNTALVTGAGGGGCGGAIAKLLAREGAHVVACDIDDDAGNEVVAQIEADGGSATFVSADVAVADDRRRLIDAVETGWSGIDILVNNASADPGELGPFEAWPRNPGVDLLQPCQLPLEAVESMRRRGSHGAIVNIGSLSALPHGKEHSPWPGYDMAKAGVMRLTTALEFLGSEGIRVNCLLPG